MCGWTPEIDQSLQKIKKQHIMKMLNFTVAIEENYWRKKTHLKSADMCQEVLQGHSVLYPQPDPHFPIDDIFFENVTPQKVIFALQKLIFAPQKLILELCLPSEICKYNQPLWNS